MTTITEVKYCDLVCLIVENQSLKIEILPELGSKMISLKYKETDFEFLARSGRTFKKIHYNTDFEKEDISGFDECFPAIEKGLCPEWPWKGVEIPDHGEVFSLPWQYEIKEHQLILSVHGIRFPYQFSKSISLDDKTVHIEYQLNNLSPFDFKYVWSSHPLLAAIEGANIILPGNPDIRTYSFETLSGQRQLVQTRWPNVKDTDGNVRDISSIRSDQAAYARKYYTTRLDEGWCGLNYPDGHSLKMEFPIEHVPYAGLWINEGGWPKTDPSYNVALEPCSSCPDGLKEAIELEEASVVKGHGINCWSLDITCFKER